MTEAIKEILEFLEDDNRERPFGISEYDLKVLKDYITNLQQENEKLKYNARGQVNDYFKDKYADEVLKKADLIKDFELTCYKNYELKQEIERLNNIINELEKLLDEMLLDTKKPTVLNNSEKIAIRISIEHIKDKLKELKESDNNE